MANDIYFGSKARRPQGDPTPQEPPRPAAAREPVARDPVGTAQAGWSRSDPAEAGTAPRQARPVVSRQPENSGAYTANRSGGAYAAHTEPAANRGGSYAGYTEPVSNRSAASGGAYPSGNGRSYTGRTASSSYNSAQRRSAKPSYSSEPYRGAPKRGEAEPTIITEQIDSELLHKAPTQMLFNYIDTEDGYASAPRDGKPMTDRKREKLRSKKIRAAQKSARKSAKRKRKSGFRRFLKAALCIVLALAVLLGGAAAYVVTGYRPLKKEANAYVNESDLMYSPSVYNLLLMGIDMQATSGTSRSDSMILLSIDNAHSKLKMTSFMRDSYVYIPEYGEAKLNAACTYGGPQLVCDTIEYNFGVRIDGYVKVGYEILMDLVDGLGGVTIPEVDSVEAAALAAEGYDAPIGTDIKMNGLQTLHYCRIRKGQDDFHRTERQREVLGILIKKVLRTDPVRLAMLGRKLIAKTECSISRAELFALAFRVVPCLIGGTASGRVPLDGTWYDDMRNSQAVLVVNFEENRTYLKDFIYG